MLLPYGRPSIPRSVDRGDRGRDASEFGERSGLLGLFYTRADGDPKRMEALPERYTAADIAEKVVRDVDHWYEAEASVCRIVDFDGLQHTVHGQGAAVSWIVE